MTSIRDTEIYCDGFKCIVLKTNYDKDGIPSNQYVDWSSVVSHDLTPEDLYIHGVTATTLGQIEDWIKAKLTNYDLVYVVADSGLHGEIFTYGNYTDEQGNKIWTKYAETKGYA